MADEICHHHTGAMIGRLRFVADVDGLTAYFWLGPEFHLFITNDWNRDRPVVYDGLLT
jgi:hypothetical protein